MNLVGNVDDGLNQSLVPLANCTSEDRSKRLCVESALGTGLLVDELRQA